MSTETDILWGAQQIARHIGRNTRQTYHLIEHKLIPHRRFGKLISASKAELDEALGRRPKQRVRPKED